MQCLLAGLLMAAIITPTQGWDDGHGSEIKISAGPAAGGVWRWTEVYDTPNGATIPSDGQDWTSGFSGYAWRMEYLRPSGFSLVVQGIEGEGLMDAGTRARAQRFALDMRFTGRSWRDHGVIIGWRTSSVEMATGAGWAKTHTSSFPALGYAYVVNPLEPGFHWNAKISSPTAVIMWFYAQDNKAQVAGAEHDSRSLPLEVEVELETGYRTAAIPMEILLGGGFLYSSARLEPSEDSALSGGEYVASGYLFVAITLRITKMYHYMRRWQNQRRVRI